ncbi:YrhK family protein [Alkalihalobacillus deserti]|uniref:YrhK family protein n=1 Tax=Alkalihalobacillus deserti TaxID=2879466 RepID=UPI001D14CF30|nr:YrhK family protein [Alkalihalobacillus deserti]
MPDIWDSKDQLEVKVGRFRLYFKKRYKLITTVNDLLIGMLFVAGSCLNFYSATETFGNVLYLCGSLFLVGRPGLRIMHDASLRKEMKDSDNYTPN